MRKIKDKAICVIILLLIIIITAINISLKAIGNYAGNDYVSSKIKIGLLIAYICTGLIIAVLIYLSKKIDKSIEQMQKKTEYMEMNEIYYKNLLEKEEKTKYYRHDMNEHLLYISSMAEKSGNEQWIEYIRKLYTDLQEIRTSTYEFGNDVANVLINYYIGQIKGIADVTVYGVWLETGKLSDYDLCIVIGNLMENAVREITEDEGEQKYINIRLLEEDEDIKMIVRNSCKCCNIEMGRDMLPKTTKSDKKAHGIGFNNVKKIVEKNNGIFKWECKENCFSVMFTMKKLPFKRPDYH